MMIIFEHEIKCDKRLKLAKKKKKKKLLKSAQNHSTVVGIYLSVSVNVTNN